MQITEEHVSDLNNVFSIGQPIKCMIIDHDKANGRIALSTKVLEQEPGDMLRNQKKVRVFVISPPFIHPDLNG